MAEDALGTQLWVLAVDMSFYVLHSNILERYFLDVLHKYFLTSNF